MIYSVALMSVV